ncbi:MAG: hypothetical protein RLZZ450_3486 [Pseudomonadota bacterium]
MTRGGFVGGALASLLLQLSVSHNLAGAQSNEPVPPRTTASPGRPGTQVDASAGESELAWPLAPGAGTGSMSVRGSVRAIGRVDAEQLNALTFSWSYSGFVVRFRGTGLKVRLQNQLGYHYVAVLDGNIRFRFQSFPGIASYELVRGVAEGEHQLELHRETEGQYGASTLLGFAGATILAPPAEPSRRIEIIGDSTSAGYGNMGSEHHRPELHDGCGFSFATESAYDTYGARAARALGSDLSIVAVSGWGVLRGNDHTPEKNVPRVYPRAVADWSRPLWSFKTQPQVVVINLGANDLRPPAPSDPGEGLFRRRYLALVRTVREKYPMAWIFCSLGPTMSDDWPTDIAARTLLQTRLQSIVADRVRIGDNHVSYLEFPRHDTALSGCDWHPSAREHEKMGHQLERAIRDKLGW